MPEGGPSVSKTDIAGSTHNWLNLVLSFHQPYGVCFPLCFPMPALNHATRIVEENPGFGGDRALVWPII